MGSNLYRRQSTAYLLTLLKLEGLAGLIAHVRGTKVLNRTWVDIVSLDCPLLAICGEELEWAAIELDESLLDDRLHLAIALLHVHHRGDRDTTCEPLRSGLSRVANRAHIASLTRCDKECGYTTKRVAVVSIEVRGGSATALVTEEVVLSSELADKLAFLLPLSEFLANHVSEELLGLDE